MLLLAFAADPVTRWTWRDPDAYVAHFPAFALAFGGRAFDHGGAALWLPPGVDPDEAALGEALERTGPARRDTARR